MAKSSTSGQGRPKGALNKANAEIKATAQKYGSRALKRLVHLMDNAENQGTQVAAAKELLDRGFGRPAQVVGGSDDLPAIAHKVTVEVVYPQPR